MAINNVSKMNEILSKSSIKEWASPSDIDVSKPLDFKDLNVDSYTKVDNKKTFSEMLASSITEVNELQKDANTAVQKLASGESKNIHETLLAVEKADIAFKTMNQIRMKVVDAYKEVMRMQI